MTAVITASHLIHISPVPRICCMRERAIIRMNTMYHLLHFLLFFAAAFFLTMLAERLSRYFFSRGRKAPQDEKNKEAIQSRLSFRGLQSGIRLLLLVTALVFFRDDIYKMIGIAGGILTGAKIQMIRLFRQYSGRESGDIKQEQ